MSNIHTSINDHFFIAEMASVIRKTVVELDDKVRKVLPPRDLIVFDRVTMTLQMTAYLAAECAEQNAPLMGHLKHAVPMVNDLRNQIDQRSLAVTDLRDVLIVFQQIVGEYSTQYNVDGVAVSTSIWKR